MLDKLNHPYTPNELQDFNAELASAFALEPFDDLKTQQIIDRRANLVESLLKSLDIEQKRCFARHEINTNDFILMQVKQKHSAVKLELAGVSKASKAIKKYKQV